MHIIILKNCTVDIKSTVQFFWLDVNSYGKFEKTKYLQIKVDTPFNTNFK